MNELNSNSSDNVPQFDESDSNSKLTENIKSLNDKNFVRYLMEIDDKIKKSIDKILQDIILYKCKIVKCFSGL